MHGHQRPFVVTAGAAQLINSTPTLSACAPDSAQIAIQVIGSGTFGTAISEDFNSGITASNWQVMDGTIANSCGTATGANALYFNNASRVARTKAINTTQGGNVNFAIKIGNTVNPCENVDPGEDVYLQYSTDGGNTWTFLASYGSGFNLGAFSNQSILIPLAARTANTIFQWVQPNFSGAGLDNWALDNVLISGYQPLTYSWSPSTGLSNPTISNPKVLPATNGTTNYTFTVSAAGGCVSTTTVAVTRAHQAHGGLHRTHGRVHRQASGL